MNVLAMAAYREPEADNPVLTIFNHWQSIHGHARSRLDLKRRKSIQSRLDDGYSMQDIIDAISGCFLSPFHQGDNERSTCYNDISLICRDAEHIDRFIGLYEDGVKAMKKAQEAVKKSQGAAEEQPSDPATARRHLEAMRKMMGRR